MISTESIVVKKKLKIKFGGKHLVSDPQTCKLEQPTTFVGDWSSGAVEDTSQNERVGKISAISSSKLRISLPVSNKRGQPEVLESPKKRQRLDRVANQHCSSLLKKLMHHQCGWPFNQPVDCVALNIPDYFTIITKPMDLGTIKSKLEKNLYLEIEEFAADVRLTFSNAMTYNPPGNDVHIMADRLNKIFESGWKVLEAKWNRGLPRAEPYTLEKQSVDGNVAGISCSKTSASAISSKVRVVSNGDLKRKSDAGVMKVKLQALVSQIKSSNNMKTGTDCDGSLASQSKCGMCPSISCRCSRASDSIRTVQSDCPSERAPGADQDHEPKIDGSTPAQSTLILQQGKPESNDNGDASAVDIRDACTMDDAVADNSDATCSEGWAGALSDVQLSPKKALRAAMLKSRFAATILKAQHKTLLDHGDQTDLMKLQKEKERLEKRQLEEKARIESQIKAAEARAEAELKKQREVDREAARIALQKMERTVEIGENLKILKELEMLSGCPLSVNLPDSDDRSEVLSGEFDASPGKNALEQLGLFMKDDYLEDDDDETVCHVEEDGEIIP